MIFNILTLIPAITSNGKNLPSTLDIIADIITAENNVEKNERDSLSANIQTGDVSF